MNVNVFNNNRAYQQLVLQFNHVRNELAHSHQATVVLQADLDQQRSIVKFEKRQMKMTSNAFQQKMEFRLRAEDDHRKKIKNVQTLITMITRLTSITTKKLEMILEKEIDVHAILNDSQIVADRADDHDDQLRQVSFTLQCYKNRTSQLRGHNQQLCQMIEEKEAELNTLKVEFGEVYSEDENIFEEQESSR
ncbi:MAG: hypothetical protein Q9195_001662 [Heterodermia aff. obscurata]